MSADLEAYIEETKAAGNVHTAAALEAALPILTKMIDEESVRGTAATNANNSLAAARETIAALTNPNGGNLFAPGNYSLSIAGQVTTAVLLPNEGPFGSSIDVSDTFSSGQSDVLARLGQAEIKLGEVSTIISDISGEEQTIVNMISYASESYPVDPFGHVDPLTDALGNLRKAIAEYNTLKSQLGVLSGTFSKIKLAIEEDQKEIDAAMAARTTSIGATAEEKEEALRQRQAILNGASAALDTTIANRLRTTFKHQCFIQRYIFDIVRDRINTLGSEVMLPYEEGADSGRNRPLTVMGQPFGFMNTLTQPKSSAVLFDLPTHVLSQLQPLVKLYKVYTDHNGKEYEAEINFPSKISFLNTSGSAITASEALRSQKRRGNGVGMKSFNFAYEGSDPFSVKKSISANLKIFAASFEEILQRRGGTKRQDQYTYADLALKTGTSMMDQYASVPLQSDGIGDSVIDNLDKLKFRLKAVVGYEMPKNLHITGTGSPRLSRDDIQAAIYNSFVTLNLTPTTHEFKFDDSGRVDFSINYLAYIDDFFDVSYFNIFSDPLITSNVYKRKVLRKYYEKTCELKQLENLKKDEEKKTPIEQQASLRRIIEKLLAKEKIHFINVSYNKLGDFVVNPLVDLNSLSPSPAGKTSPAPVTKPPTPKQSALQAKQAAEIAAAPETAGKRAWYDFSPVPLTKDQLRQQFGVSKNGTTRSASAGINANNDEQIGYFYLYDLIEVVMGNIEDSLADTGYAKVLDTIPILPPEMVKQEKKVLSVMRKNFKRYRTVLGPCEIRDPSTPGNYLEASLGDIPISLTYFAEWMTEKVIARDRVEYNLTSFINDIIKNYVRNFMNSESCYGASLKQRLSTYSTSLTSYLKPGDTHDEITNRILKDRILESTPDLDRLRLEDETGASVFADCLLNVMGRRNLPGANLGVENEINYQIFYSGRNHPNNYKIGSYDQDISRGIFHYVLGKNSGIIKNIDLRRTDATGLKELRFEQQGFDGLQQLREVYNATVTTFAFPSALPGINIFIDPRGFAPDTDPIGKQFNKYDLSQYGIGGYYMINKAETQFGVGIAETKISAVWVAEQETMEKKPPPGKIEGAPPSSAKCKSKRSKQKPKQAGINPTGSPPAGDIDTP
tara:strand:- start:2274 stop:5657 length:3384 start_codon:yes stop_codon:yes gene_type:complete